MGLPLLVLLVSTQGLAFHDSWATFGFATMEKADTAIDELPRLSVQGQILLVKLIKDALVRQGFKEQNITVITDKQATAAGISSAIDKYLIEKASCLRKH